MYLINFSFFMALFHVPLYTSHLPLPGSPDSNIKPLAWTQFQLCENEQYQEGGVCVCVCEMASKPISLFKSKWCSSLMRLNDNECNFFSSWSCSFYWRTKAESVTQSVLSAACVGAVCASTQSSESLQVFISLLLLILSLKEYRYATLFTTVIFTWQFKT